MYNSKSQTVTLRRVLQSYLRRRNIYFPGELTKKNQAESKVIDIEINGIIITKHSIKLIFKQISI